MSNFKVNIITNVNDEFLGEWQNLWDNSDNAHLFNSPRWFLTVSDAFDIKDYLVFVCYQKEKLVAVCPFVYSRRFGIKVLASVGSKYSDKSPLLIYQKDGRLLKFFLSQIFKFGNLYLPELDYWTVEVLKRGKSAILLDTPTICPFIPKESDFLAFMDKRQRRKVRSEAAKNQENLRFRTYSKEKDTIMKTVFAIEGASSRRAGGKATFTDKKAVKLFDSIMKYWLEEVSLDVLYFKDKPVSYMLGILNSRIYYAINTAYLEGFQDIIPGKMVLYYLLQRLQASGVELFDFLRGTSRFKQDFTPFFSEQYDIYFSKNFLIRIWWTLAVNFTNFIKESGLLYKIYLAFKKRALDLTEQHPKLAHT